MQRYYGIADPLGLTWRRFMALLTNLPPDSAFISRLRAEMPDPQDEFTPSSVVDFIDAQKGRRYDEKRQSSLDRWMQ